MFLFSGLNRHIVTCMLAQLSALRAVMLTRPAGHEAKAEARNSEAEDKAEAQKFFTGRGQTRYRTTQCV